jgi:O-antigen ligase
MTRPSPPSDWPLVPLAVFSLGSFTGIAIAQSALAAGAVLLFIEAWAKRRWPAPQAASPVTGLVSVLVFYFSVQILAVFLSRHVARSVACLRGDLPVLFLPLLILLAMRARRPIAALWIFLACGAASGLYGAWQFLFGLDLYRARALEALPGAGFMAVGNMGGHLTYGGVQLIATLLGMGLFLHGSKGRARSTAGLLTLAAGSGLVGSAARTAWIGAAAGTCLLVSLLDGRKRLAGWAGLAALAAGALLLPGVGDRLGLLIRAWDLPRARLWETALRMWADAPLFGGGLGSFKTLFPAYKVEGLYDSTIHPHNDLLNVAVHSGAAGVLAFGVLWVWILRSLRRRRKGSDTARAVASGSLAAAVGFLVAGMGQCYFTDEEPMMALWFAVALGVTAGWDSQRRAAPMDIPEDPADAEPMEATAAGRQGKARAAGRGPLSHGDPPAARR